MIHLEIPVRVSSQHAHLLRHFKYHHICWMIQPDWQSSLLDSRGMLYSLFLFCAPLSMLANKKSSELRLLDKTGFLKIQQVMDTYEALRKIASQLLTCPWHTHVTFSDHFESYSFIIFNDVCIFYQLKTLEHFLRWRLTTKRAVESV